MLMSLIKDIKTSLIKDNARQNRHQRSKTPFSFHQSLPFSNHEQPVPEFSISPAIIFIVVEFLLQHLTLVLLAGHFLLTSVCYVRASISTNMLSYVETRANFLFEEIFPQPMQQASVSYLKFRSNIPFYGINSLLDNYRIF